MSWQDIILTIGNLLLAASLVPSIISKDKPALSTSLLTGSILFAFGVVYITLSLWISVGAIALNVVLWFVLAIQQYRQLVERKKAHMRNGEHPQDFESTDPTQELLADEIERFCTIAEAYDVPVELDTPKFRLTIWPDLSARITLKHEGESKDNPT